MKVLLFSNLYPSLREPTRGMFHYNLFGALAERCEVRLISPLPWWTRARRPGEWVCAPRESHTGIDVTFPTYWSVPRFPALHARGMAASLGVHTARLHRQFPFDIIFAAWAYPDAAAAARLARQFRCPIVINVLGSDINETARLPNLRPQVVQALQQAQRTVAVSGALKERVVELGIAEDRVVVQHNGVNGEQFTVRDRYEMREMLGLPKDRKLICFVGNFKPEKGVDILVSAMDDLRRRGRTDTDLVMVGSGPMEAGLRADACRSGMEKHVHFVGRKLHTEIPHWIAACDVFCLPSRREGCPNVVLEGLASGRPVVATAVGGVPELINRANGILVPAENPSALAAGLSEALDRTWDAAMLRRSVERLSWSEVGRALHHILEVSLEEHRSAAVEESLRLPA